MCDGAELDMKLLVGRRNQLAVGTLHRSPHRTCKIRNAAGPFALSNLHFIGMINQMIVWERLEKFDRLRLVILAPSCRLGLTRPKYGGVLGMPLFKRIPVLCVPLRSGPQSGRPHEQTATRSKFHAPARRSTCPGRGGCRSEFGVDGFSESLFKNKRPEAWVPALRITKWLRGSDLN